MLFLFCFLQANNTWQPEVRVGQSLVLHGSTGFWSGFLLPVFSDMRLRMPRGSQARLAETA